MSTLQDRRQFNMLIHHVESCDVVFTFISKHQSLVRRTDLPDSRLSGHGQEFKMKCHILHDFKASTLLKVASEDRSATKNGDISVVIMCS